jgi:hypothetical protein
LTVASREFGHFYGINIPAQDAVEPMVAGMGSRLFRNAMRCAILLAGTNRI